MATYRAADSQTITTAETDIFVSTKTTDSSGEVGTNGPPVSVFSFTVVSGTALVRVYPSTVAEQITLTSSNGTVLLGENSNRMGVTRITVQGSGGSCVVSWFPTVS